MNILISSAGRRVGLLRAFRSSLSAAGLSGRVLAVDASPYSAALQDADDGWVVPRCTDPEFIPTMLDLCERERVALVVPTIDTELRVYSESRNVFAQQSTLVAVSSPETVRIAGDKRRTNDHFLANGIPTARQLGSQDGGPWASEGPQFPVIVKPSQGSAGIGVETIGDPDTLQRRLASDPDLIVEELMPGQEYTVNVYVNGLGECVAQVPHRRIEVRAGEVSKGVTVHHAEVMDVARNAVESLPDAFGALCLQGRMNPATQVVHFFEINARFGGGYPLTHAAGADFAACLLREAAGDPVRKSITGWTQGLAMLRYDEPIFQLADNIEGRATWLRNN